METLEKTEDSTKLVLFVTWTFLLAVALLTMVLFANYRELWQGAIAVMSGTGFAYTYINYVNKYDG